MIGRKRQERRDARAALDKLTDRAAYDADRWTLDADRQTRAWQPTTAPPRIGTRKL